MDKNPIWSDSVLETRIMTYGYQMAEMGRQQTFEMEARNSGNYDMADMYAKRAEMYREATYTLIREISGQLTLRRTDTLVTA